MSERDELLARIDQLERSVVAEFAAAEERGRLQGQFSPLGDNHHNAAACPYCGDLLAKAEERGRRSGVEEERERAIWIAQNVACALDEGDRYIKAAHRIADMLADPKLGHRPNALAPRDSGKEG